MLRILSPYPYQLLQIELGVLFDCAEHEIVVQVGGKPAQVACCFDTGGDEAQRLGHRADWALKQPTAIQQHPPQEV